MPEKKDNIQPVDEARRDFLRKSIYAAYATPVITALLVSKASAKTSRNPNCSDAQWRQDHPDACR